MAALPADARLGVAAITIWAAAMLEAKGRVSFHPDLDSRVREMLARDLCPGSAAACNRHCQRAAGRFSR